MNNLVYSCLCSVSIMFFRYGFQIFVQASFHSSVVMLSSVISGAIVHFMFHVRFISIHKLWYLSFSSTSTSFCLTFSPLILLNIPVRTVSLFFFFKLRYLAVFRNSPICAPDCITLTLSYSHTLLLLLLLLLFYPPERCKWDARDVINSFMIFVFVLRNPKISTHGTRKCSDHCSISHWCARYEYIAKILPSLQNWRARQNVVTIMTVN